MNFKHLVVDGKGYGLEDKEKKKILKNRP